MRYVAAYLLAAMGGGGNPSSADIEKILESVGIEAEADKIKKVISELKGKDLDEVIAEGELIRRDTCNGVFREIIAYS